MNKVEKSYVWTLIEEKELEIQGSHTKGGVYFDNKQYDKCLEQIVFIHQSYAAIRALEDVLEKFDDD